MKINKLNYEAFLLDYLENQLNEPLRSELLAFVKAHPELDIDLQNWEPVYVQPDLSVQFPDTNTLMKPIATGSSPRRIRPVYWVSLVAAVLAGALLVALFLLPQKAALPVTPIADEEQPVKQEPIPIIDKRITANQQMEAKEDISVVVNEDQQPVSEEPIEIEIKEPVSKEIAEAPEPSIKRPLEEITPEPLKVIAENPTPEKEVPTPSPALQEQPKPESVVAEANVPETKEETPKITPELLTEETIVAEVPILEPNIAPAEPVAEVAIELTEKQTLAELDIKDKKKRKLFPRFKERFGNGKLTSAFLPEAYGGE